MLGIGTLFCLILMNIIGGAVAVGEEADNGNAKKDLLSDEMWRMAFEANRHNWTETKEKEEKQKEVKKELKKEEEGEEEKKGIKLWKNVKKEPIEYKLKEEEEQRDGDNQQLDDAASDQNDTELSAYDDKKTENGSVKLTDEIKLKIITTYNKMRKECKMRGEYNSKIRAKIEHEIAKALGTYRNKIFEWKRELIQKMNIEGVQRKRDIIEKFDKMRKEYKKKKGYTNEKRGKIEVEIAKALGTHRDKIYEWKRELNRKNASESDEERKRDIIEEFDRMRKERTNKKGYTNGMRSKIEKKIAKALGTNRDKIYEWKRELNSKKEAISEERIRKIVEMFDKLRNENPTDSNERKQKIIKEFDKKREEYKMKKRYKSVDRHKMEHKIAKALGESRGKIYKWKRELIEKKKPESEEEKWEIIEQFDSMRNEYKMNKENRIKIEQKIAKELGTCRTNIYEWKKTLNEPPLRVFYTEEQKKAIIAKFDDLCEEFSNKFNMKPSKKIEEKIAKKFHVSRKSIYTWKKELY